MSEITQPPSSNIEPVLLEEEMKSSYLDYAMSVIVSRALPDVRDGLKPVHRRILYAMKDGGYTPDKPFRKSAKIVGEVMGNYHPHGDSAIYDAMVRLAQDFSMRLPLVDKQGNFGSMDGDPAAAMRYTEARLAKVAAEGLLKDIDKDTVNFQPNYDESTQEPTVLPAEFPNLLVNGAGGIAVGMATNIPTHNLGEVIDGTLALIDNPQLEIAELIQIIPGPDFPTGGLIMGRSGIASAYATGRGSVIMRAKVEQEEMAGDRVRLVVTEIPYQVNKARLVERIGELVRDKIIEGISDLRDESSREGVRVVVEIRRDAQAEVVLAQLYKHTPLQTSFGCNMLALHQNRPLQMNLKDMLQAFIDFREEVIARRSAFELTKARERAHILCGLVVAVANIDEVISMIRAAKDPETAKQALMTRDWSTSDMGALIQRVEDLESAPAVYKLSEAQAKAILELRLQRLTGLERDKISEELEGLVKKIDELLEILGNREVLFNVMRAELRDIKEKYATPRRTSIEDSELDQDIEDLIQREDMVVTVSHKGYIKRVPLSTYRTQRRGGKGRAGMATRDDDFVSRVFVANTHTPVLFFTSNGMVHELKVYRLPAGTPTSLGKPMINLLPLDKDETISTVMPLPEDETTWDHLYVMFATSSGSVRRNPLSEFTNIRANGKIAMKLEGGEKLISVQPCRGDQDIMLASREGKAIRFLVDDVRVFQSRNSVGVRGMKLAASDEVMSMSVLDRDREQFILTVSAKGYAKRTSSEEYRVIGRGGQGVTNMALSDKTGTVVRSFPVEETDQVMLVSNGGQLIRCPVQTVRIAGRATQGVIMFKMDDGEQVVSVARLAETDEEDGEPVDGEAAAEADLPNTPPPAANDAE